MESKEIQKLLDFIAHSPLDEVSIETSEIKLAVKRYGNAPAVQQVAVNHIPAAVQAPVAQVAAPAATPSIQASKPADNLIAVKSPMIGTFYRSASPDKPSLIEIGSEINTGTPVCIIEAMKLFNEIESEVSGRIVKILVENATPVEYDQPLFLVEPI